MVAVGLSPRMTIFALRALSKHIGELVEVIRSKAKDGRARKVSLHKMDDFLQKYSFPELFNLLPDHFASYQRDVVAEIRSLAIDCFNEHDDPDLSKGVLSLCKRFRSGMSNSPTFGGELQDY